MVSVAGYRADEESVHKVVREDVLRILGEREKKTPLNFVSSEINVSRSLFEKVVSSLEKDGFVQVENGFVRLTGKGMDAVKDIVKKHLVLEDYFREKKRQKQPHEAAHLLEHYISNQVIDNIMKLSSLKETGVPLTSFELHKKGLITDLFFSDQALFERIVSMGIFLGENLTVTNKIANGIIVKVGNTKYALDKEVAKNIKVS